MSRIARGGIAVAVALATAACGDSMGPEQDANRSVAVRGTVVEEGQPVPDATVELGYRIYLGLEYGGFVERWETHALSTTLSRDDGGYALEGRLTNDACAEQVYVLARRGDRSGLEILSCGTHEAVEIDISCVSTLVVTCSAPQLRQP